jgi:hypothetical protein
MGEVAEAIKLEEWAIAVAKKTPGLEVQAIKEYEAILEQMKNREPIYAESLKWNEELLKRIKD